MSSDSDPHSLHAAKRFSPASVDKLRSPERLALLEVDHVAALSLEGAVFSSVLDVGAGSGVFAGTFAARGLSAVGLDASHAMGGHFARWLPRAAFAVGTAEELPFASASFDLLFLGHVLHETAHPLRALREARRVARGRVVVLEWPYRVEEKGPPLDHRLSPERLSGLAREAGFSLLDTPPLAHMLLFRLVC